MVNQVEPPARHAHFRSLKAEADAARNPSERFADSLVGLFGSIPFLILHVIWFAGWVSLNVGAVPFVEPFDPFPFGLLTMIVSLEAIFLSVFVLISQNRAQRIADLREEISLRVTTQSEKEVTETLRIVDAVARHLKVKIPRERTAKLYEKDLDSSALKHQIEKEI
jgi:uncharacterized membrane protein